MNILYFTLGSPGKRFYGNLDKFQDLFEEDIIFFGPTAEKSFIYKDKIFNIIGLEKQQSIFQIFECLPTDWYPDIVVVETPVLNYIYDFYLCPVKTLCLSRDAWGEMIYNRSISKLFDFVFYQTIDYNNYKNNNFIPMYGTGLTCVEDSLPIDIKKRKIDVLAIANYNTGLYYERYRIFFKVANELGHKYNIKFITGINVDELGDYFRNSKIILDWSNVLSIRAFDAIHNGCLLFHNDDNILIKKIFSENYEYVAYNKKNIIDLLNEYLNDFEKMYNVIENAQYKLNQNDQDFGNVILRRIYYCTKKNIKIRDRIERIEKMNQSEIAYCLSTPLSFNNQYQGHNHPANWRELYFERTDKALSLEATKELRIKELIEAMRMAFLLKKEEKFNKYSRELEEICPNYGWNYFFRARFNFNKGDYRLAIYDLKKSLNAHNLENNLVSKYMLPFIEKGNSNDGRRVLDYMWESVYHHKNKFQVNVFLGEVYTLLAKCQEMLNEKETAIENYSIAIDNFAVPKTGYALFNLFFKEKKYAQLQGIFQKIIEDSPYDMLSNLYLSLVYLCLKNKKASLGILVSFSRGISSFYVKPKFLNKVRVKKTITKFLIIAHVLPLVIVKKIMNIIIIKVGKRL